MWLTLDISARAVGFGLPIAILCAYVLARKRFPGRWLLDVIAHLPLVLPPVVVGWALLLILGIRGPVGAWLLGWFGIRLVFTSAGAAVACGVMAFPLMLRAVRQSIEALDPGIEQAAQTLGAGPLDRFVTITLPMVVPGILAAAIVGYAASLGEFGAVITFAANIPGRTQTLPLAIYAALQSPGGEATATKLSLVSVALAFLLLGGATVAERALGRRAGR